jgi:ATP-binding cassette subfamily B protein
VLGRIEFRNVWFAYHDDDWVLRDISFVVEPGERAALVGHTGAGKTTIASLLLRFYDIQRGQILLDNVDIRQMDLAELRSCFSMVLQEPALFAGDIASNIRLGDQGISQDKIRAAVSDVCMDAFISNLKNGCQTDLRERGSNLSVGQKQLIGFARALAFDRRILILDEATSSIDTETEMLVRNAVKRLMIGRTSLVIAHRLSTIQSVNKILVMHKGEIRERGDHPTLLAQRGLYWRLYQLQFDRDFRQARTNTMSEELAV